MSGIIGGAGSKSGVIGTTELDYEEGTWVARIEGSGADPSATCEDTDAKYTKIGDLVYCQYAINNVDTTGGNGTLQIWGLPYIPAWSGPAGGSYSWYNVNFPAGDEIFTQYVTTSNYMYWLRSLDTSVWYGMEGCFGSSQYWKGCFQYQTN